MKKQTRDIASLFSDPYSKSAPKVLEDQHRFLLDNLKKNFAKNGTLVIIGPGSYVLPYSCKYTKEGKLGSSNRDRIKKIIGNGRIVLVDYVLDEANGGLEKGIRTLEQLGFFQEGYFKKGKFYPIEILNPGMTKESSISFIVNNLRENLKISDMSVSAIDANLSIHHASVTREELKRIYSELFRILRPGGLLHLGEGNVDMNYTEDKIIRLGQDVSSITGNPVLITDEREIKTGYVMKAYFEPKNRYKNLPIVQKDSHEKKLSVKITEDGLFVIGAKDKGDIQLNQKESGKISENLRANGYKQVLLLHDSIVMPLIDPQMREDFKKYIKPVNAYYDAIKERAEGYSGLDDSLHSQIIEACSFERCNALKGIVEYYMGKDRILKTLKNTGFEDAKVKHHSKEPFYNITARKPL